MFATHLPIDGLLWTCSQLLCTTRDALAGVDAAAPHSLFGGTANRIYLSA